MTDKEKKKANPKNFFSISRWTLTKYITLSTKIKIAFLMGVFKRKGHEEFFSKINDFSLFLCTLFIAQFFHIYSALWHSTIIFT